MKFVSWNIDGLNAALTSDSNRATMSRQTLYEISKGRPDILALQETKLSKLTDKHKKVIFEMFPGYSFVHTMSKERKGYAGVMILYKDNSAIASAPHILEVFDEDDEGRIATLEFEDFFLSTVYTPNSGRGLTRLPHRELWDEEYSYYIQELQKTKPVILCGDFNVANEEIDLKNPKGKSANPGFTDSERESFKSLLSEGFIDTLRHIHGAKEGMFTWWTQLSKTAKTNNSGWRLDYFLISDELKDDLVDAGIMDTGQRADHAPVYIEMSF